jgi:hypothetical protein
MVTYKLDDNNNPVPVDDLQEWAQWYCENQAALVILQTDIKDKRGRYKATVVTRFRGQINSPAESTQPLVWVTETTDGNSFGAVSSRKEAEVNHRRMVRMLENCYSK